jgi:hypothetical protein
MSEDRQERARVYTKIAPLILQFAAIMGERTFHVETLRRFVRHYYPDIAPDSPGRILRQLRLEGRLDYVVLHRRMSLYVFCTRSKKEEAA